jgi:RNA polymerase primary sigma factor
MEEAVVPALGPICFRYGYEEALRDRVIADFEVAYVGLSFVPEEQQPYDELTHEIGQLQQTLRSRYPSLRSGKFFANLQVLLRREEDPAIERYLGLLGQRRRLLMSAGARADFVEWLVRYVRHGRQTFLFHDSISGLPMPWWKPGSPLRPTIR